MPAIPADGSAHDLPQERRRLITIREAADLCRVDYDTMLRWVAKGVIPYKVVGPSNRKRVYQRDVEALLIRDGVAQSS